MVQIHPNLEHLAIWKKDRVTFPETSIEKLSPPNKFLKYIFAFSLCQVMLLCISLIIILVSSTTFEKEKSKSFEFWGP